VPGQVAGKIQHTPGLTVGMVEQSSTALNAHSPPFEVHKVSSADEQLSVFASFLEQAPVLGLLFCPFACSRQAS
jgi:hypothetical protein